MSVFFRALLATSALVIALAGSAWAAVEDDIAKRLAPVGDLCMAGDECAAAVVAVASGPRSGDEVYSTKCVACHGTGAAGAPKLGDAADWAARSEKGLDTLIANAINGVGGMPAKGLCADCSDDEIGAAVEHMLAKSQ